MTTEERINQVIAEKINPQLGIHDGSAALTSFEDDIAYVKFLGACASCMTASDTFESVVKAEILANVPEVKDVILDDSVSQDLIDMARRILNGEFR